MKIHESAENYLETILILRERKGNVRSIDIVNELSYSKPSVSIAMKHLRENGYVNMDSDGSLTLTPAGEEIAARMYERHQMLTGWFRSALTRRLLPRMPAVLSTSSATKALRRSKPLRRKNKCSFLRQK